MYQYRFGSNEMSWILAPRWSELGRAYGQIGLLALLLLLVPLGLILWLYARYEPSADSAPFTLSVCCWRCDRPFFF